MVQLSGARKLSDGISFNNEAVKTCQLYWWQRIIVNIVCFGIWEKDHVLEHRGNILSRGDSFEKRVAATAIFRGGMNLGGEHMLPGVHVGLTD